MAEGKSKKLVFSKETKKESWDDTFKLMSWWDEKKVAEANVMVVGAGALGNEVLKNLALLNVGNIFVIDFDTIEYANLCRSVLFREEDCGTGVIKSQVAANRIKEMNPNVKTKAVKGDIMIDVGLGVFRRMDVIIGCLDNRIARLFINRYAFMTGKTWIDGAIENMSGQLCVYRYPQTCYECYLTEYDWKNIRHKLGCADIAQRNSAVGRVPTTPISGSIIASMQVQEALKVIHGYDDKLMLGEHLKYDGMNNWIFNYKAEELNEDCDSHFVISDSDLTEAKELSHKSTVADTLKYLKELYKDEQISIQLNYKIILEVTGMKSEKSHDLIIAEPHFVEEMQEQYAEIPGEQIGITKSINYINDEFPDHSMTLADLGIAPLHILSVETSSDILFVELTGDENYLRFE